MWFWCDSVQEHADSGRDIILDVDPEAVRKGVRSFMQQVAQIERERVAVIFFNKRLSMYFN